MNIMGKGGGGMGEKLGRVGEDGREQGEVGVEEQ